MNISIMIPTKNRPNFILRLLEYYSKSEFKGYILIGDASDKHLFIETKNNILKYKNRLKIQHFYEPDLLTDETNSFLSKHVKTDFCAYVADDDIILVSSLIDCINFLIQNPEYSAVHGLAFLMSMEDRAMVSIRDYKMVTSVKDNSLDRVEDFFIEMSQLNMSVIRTNINKYDVFSSASTSSGNNASIFWFSSHLVIVLFHLSRSAGEGFPLSCPPRTI